MKECDFKILPSCIFLDQLDSINFRNRQSFFQDSLNNHILSINKEIFSKQITKFNGINEILKKNEDSFHFSMNSQEIIKEKSFINFEKEKLSLFENIKKELHGDVFDIVSKKFYEIGLNEEEKENLKV